MEKRGEGIERLGIFVEFTFYLSSLKTVKRIETSRNFWHPSTAEAFLPPI